MSYVPSCQTEVCRLVDEKCEVVRKDYPTNHEQSS